MGVNTQRPPDGLSGLIMLTGKEQERVFPGDRARVRSYFRDWPGSAFT